VDGGVALAASTERITRRENVYYFRGLIEVDLGEGEQELEYTIGNQRYSFVVPAKDQLPRLAYTSCNGFHTGKVPFSMKENEVGAMWESLKEVHSGKSSQVKRDKAYHLLVMGGDQIYADSTIERFEQDQLGWNWFTKEHTKRNAELESADRKWLEKGYTRLYTDVWAQNPVMMEMFATCPAVMMWDDHDIMDGWGSHPDRREKWPVYKDGVFEVAREAFLLYQQHCGPEETPEGVMTLNRNLSNGFRMGSAAILNLDTRTERKPEQIMTKSNWKRIDRWLTQETEGLKHLFVCLSVPAVYANLEWIEELLESTPGVQSVEDDLRDHWRSRPHRSTRVKLLESLFEVAKTGCRVTLLSGDVHVAAHGIVTLKDGGKDDGTRRHRLHQLVSSPILNSPGHAFAATELKRQGSAREDINATMSAEMSPLEVYRKGKSRSSYFVGQRNWLSLVSRDECAYRAEWYFEGAEDPFKVEIHSC
tara:strand:+ start:2869 stop:4299 length:1431 start_codon:yes stop_codon:yes gene_type:complete